MDEYPFDEQLEFPFYAPAIKDTAPTRTAQRTVTEDGACKACRTFSYLCPICCPR